MSEHVTFVEVYRAKNTPQALVMQQALEEAGMTVVVENALLQGAVGELPMGWATAPRLLVEAVNAARARDLLESRERYEVPPATGQGEADGTDGCLACGAPMAEADEACPACGWSFGKGKGD